MGHPVQVQAALVVLVGARCYVAAVQPELGVIIEAVAAACGTARPREQLGVLGVVQQAELDQAGYLIPKLGCSLDPLLRGGIRERFTAASAVPGEANAEGVAEEFHPGGHIHWLSSHSSYLRLL
ncbi:hypothetical protein D3C84_886200 [compost metagenome]